MDSDKYLKAVVEAILYASPTSVELSRLEQVLQTDKKTLLDVLDELKKDCSDNSRGICVIRKGDNFQFITKKELGEKVSSYLSSRKTGLSNAAMETLAIAAYNQPVTKTYISRIRGVSSSEIVEALVEKGLLREDGKTDFPGHPMGYVTTDKFLTVFNLDSLDDLPDAEYFADELPPDISEEIVE